MGVPKFVLGRHLLAAATPGGGLSSNLLVNPNGSFQSAPWTPGNLGAETGGQTDPLSGTSAVSEADTAANTTHLIQQSQTSFFGAGHKYFVTVYFKPGTYTGGMICTLDNQNCQVSVTNTGTAAIVLGSPTNVNSVGVANGWFKLTFNWTGLGGIFFNLYFGTSVAAYVGSGQTNLWWGLSIQEVLP